MSTGKVKVLYKYVDGAHFFIGGDDLSDGLCVADADIADAYQEVAAQLSILAKENVGENWEFTPEVSSEDLMAWIRGIAAPPSSPIFPMPQAIVNWLDSKQMVAA
jgi:hypothetical protein